MWPFKKKKEVKQLPDRYVYAKAAGSVVEVRAKSVIVGEIEYPVKKILVRVGQEVKKGQLVGRK